MIMNMLGVLWRSKVLWVAEKFINRRTLDSDGRKVTTATVQLIKSKTKSKAFKD